MFSLLSLGSKFCPALVLQVGSGFQANPYFPDFIWYDTFLDILDFFHGSEEVPYPWLSLVCVLLLKYSFVFLP